MQPPLDIEAQCAPALSKVRRICKERRLRLHDWFATFDRFGTKRCTVPQFKRALRLAGLRSSRWDGSQVLSGGALVVICAGIYLSTAELDGLAEQFQVPFFASPAPTGGAAGTANGGQQKPLVSTAHEASVWLYDQKLGTTPKSDSFDFGKFCEQVRRQRARQSCR
jgi:hypothetical protein